jgi:hypothetical protein
MVVHARIHNFDMDEKIEDTAPVGKGMSSLLKPKGPWRTDMSLAGELKGTQTLSLRDTAATMSGRLRSILDQVAIINDKVHGTPPQPRAPRSASLAIENAPIATPSLRDSILNCDVAIIGIELEIERITDRL